MLDTTWSIYSSGEKGSCLLFLAKRGLRLEAVGSSSESDCIMFAVRSDVRVLAIDGQSGIFGLRIVEFTLLLSGCTVTGFIAVNKIVGKYFNIMSERVKFYVYCSRKILLRNFGKIQNHGHKEASRLVSTSISWIIKIN